MFVGVGVFGVWYFGGWLSICVGWWAEGWGAAKPQAVSRCASFFGGCGLGWLMRRGKSPTEVGAIYCGGCGLGLYYFFGVIEHQKSIPCV